MSGWIRFLAGSNLVGSGPAPSKTGAEAGANIPAERHTNESKVQQTEYCHALIRQNCDQEPNKAINLNFT